MSPEVVMTVAGGAARSGRSRTGLVSVRSGVSGPFVGGVPAVAFAPELPPNSP